MTRRVFLLFLGVVGPGLVSAGCSSSSGGTAPTSNPDASQTTAGDDSGCIVFSGKLDDNEVAAGKALVETANCASCHQGDAGSLAGSMLGLDGGAFAYPPNLTPDQATGLGCWTDQQIEDAVSMGFDNEGAPLCIMPRFTFDGGATHELVQYLRSLPVVSNQVPDTNCP